MRTSVAFFAAFLSTAVTAIAAGLSAADTAAVRAVTQEYRDAWLANDPERVMATLTSDAVLLPSGLSPIVGDTSIRRFWWPETAPATRVTAMELQIQEIDGRDDLAIVRGLGTLTFTTGTSPSTSIQSTFVNVVRRRSDGRWLIARRMWSDMR
jgi:uncharacterized protein (TIGR02246 family)